jgi:predicted nucleotidyltransferase
LQTVGIIVEYNPLHYGHVYHFEQSKLAAGAEAVIAVMSGHFLQRGEPAIVNKWARAEMALQMGVDVVIELPVAYASQPAEWFAYGAASLLDATGVVNSLCFGSENGDLGWFENIAEKVTHESESFQELVKNRLQSGSNFPAAYSSALSAFTTDVSENELHKPNNTLGLHYVMALRRLGSVIRPFTITRQKAGYHQQDVTDHQIASATAIRRLLHEEGQLNAVKSLLPAYTHEILQREWGTGRAPINWAPFTQPLLHRLVSSSAEQLGKFAEVTEGLEHRIKRMLPQLDFSSIDVFEELLTAIKTKRYTRTKLQRMLLHILLGHSKEELTPQRLVEGPSYIRVLGFSEKGRSLLHTMKRTARLPVITKVTQHRSPYLELDIRATATYALAYNKINGTDLIRDYAQAPIYDLGGKDAK